MESDWSANVWILGLGAMGITRCARLHDNPVGIITNFIQPGSPYTLVMNYPLHPDTDNYGAGALLIAGRPTSFPYGYDVD